MDAHTRMHTIPENLWGSFQVQVLLLQWNVLKQTIQIQGIAELVMTKSVVRDTTIHPGAVWDFEAVGMDD